MGVLSFSGRAEAVEVPPTGSVFSIQTNGPAAALGLGDYYSSNAAGAGAGYHYLLFSVPCSWPTSVPVTVDLFSPEINVDAAALALSEEASAPYSTTDFELYGPGVTPGPGPAEPAPGSGTTRVSYAPSSPGQPESWVRFTTIAPAACGTYTLRAATDGDDQNGWRLRVGADTDVDITTPPVDDLDGVPGTDDEISIGIAQTTYQQDSGARACFNLLSSSSRVRPHW
jgi:hypothetical protein